MAEPASERRHMGIVAGDGQFSSGEITRIDLVNRFALQGEHSA